MTAAMKAGSFEAAQSTVFDSLKIRPRKDLHIYNCVSAKEIWNLEGWVSYCAQKMFLWGNKQRSAGTTKEGERVVRQQTMPKSRQVYLVRAFLDVSPRQRIFLSKCRRDGDRIELIKSAQQPMKGRITAAALRRRAQPWLYE